MDESALIENMVAWATSRLGDADYRGWCLSFVEDALEKSCDIEVFGGDCARESAELYADGLKTGMPERGSFVFYDCLCEGEAGPVDWGHCGIALDDGAVIHAWDQVRIDDYRAIEHLTTTTGDHPTYLGWVPIARVLKQRPQAADATPEPEPIVLREIASDEAPRLRPCLEALAEHHNRVSIHFQGRYPKAPYDETIERFVHELDEGSSRIAVVEKDGAIIGFCKVDLTGTVGSLDYLVLLPGCRGQGLGDTLMGWALQTFEEAGVADIDVKVADGNNAYTFYERYGFKPNVHILRLSRGSAPTTAMETPEIS